MQSGHAVGVRHRRGDGEAKVRGATRFGADLDVPGMLHARPVLAADAHARLLGIDGSEALEIPGVVAVLTAADLPIAEGAGGRSATPLAREEIVWSGQPVALVLAETPAAAADGAERVIVDADPLPEVLDLEAAMAPGSPLTRVSGDARGESDVGSAHTTVAGGDGGEAHEDLSANVVRRKRLRHGDAGAEAALAGSAVRVSGRFETSWLHQGYIEPQVATAVPEPDGTLTVHVATQGIFLSRKELAATLGLPLHRVRIRATELGGAFGGKLVLMESLAGSAALAVGRPVRVELTRSEDFAAMNPAPQEILELEIGATADGRFTGLRGRIVADTGAVDEYPVETTSALLAAGPYRWEATDIATYGVLTNRVGFGSYRAPGAPPAAFALESLVDELAGELGIDPLELRVRNAMVKGDSPPGGEPLASFGAVECLERARAHPLWRDRASLPHGEGVGLAIGWWPGGLEPAAAACKVDSDGGVTVVTGAVDMSGTQAGFAAIAAEAFGVPVESVRVIAADTEAAPFAGVAGGSKITYTVGRAVEQAAADARAQLLEAAARELEIAAEDLEIADGQIRPVGAPSRGIGIADLASKILDFGSPHPPVEGHGTVAQTSLAPSVAAHLSHVRVDRETGRVELLGHVVIQDAGRALNPALVEGQMLGGTVQGMGWALYEDMAYDEAGQLRAGNFADYVVPTTDLVPAIDCEIVEVPAPDGPFGAKGIGEPPVIATAAAVANALFSAAGVRMRELPMTPERVWRALGGAEV